MKLLRTIANLGYGSRKQVQAMFREGLVTNAEGEVLYADDQVSHETVRIDGEPLDPPAGLVLMLNKPIGTPVRPVTRAALSTTCCRHASACGRRCCRRSAGWTV